MSSGNLARPPARRPHGEARHAHERAGQPRRPAGSRRSRCWRAGARPGPACACPAQALARARPDRRSPSRSTGMRSTGRGRKPMPVQDARVLGGAEEQRGGSRLRRGGGSSGVRTILAASVPPLVKMTFLALAPTRAATWSRARSRSRRARHGPRHGRTRGCPAAQAHAPSPPRPRAAAARWRCGRDRVRWLDTAMRPSPIRRTSLPSTKVLQLPWVAVLKHRNHMLRRPRSPDGRAECDTHDTALE